MAVDAFHRTIDYLRISVTDRCNLRCVYCMPPEGVPWKPPSEILSFEEVARFTAAAVREGITKIRITGGEPLVRRNVVALVGAICAIPGIDTVAMTTNGTLLPRLAGELRAAGLSRVNISLDSLDPQSYARVTRGGNLYDAMAGIDAAFQAGMGPIKINTVVVRSLGQNLVEFAKLTLDRPIHVRFIEYMPVGGDADCGAGIGSSGEWTRADCIPSDEILSRLACDGARAGLGPLEPLDRLEGPRGWGPASYYRFAGAAGTIGVISPLSHLFCGSCNRLRLTADGKVRTCLFSDQELDARSVLRNGDDLDLHSLLEEALARKPYSHQMRVGTARRMSQIGG